MKIKNTLLTLLTGLLVLGLAPTASAHCGVCGTGDKAKKAAGHHKDHGKAMALSAEKLDTVLQAYFPIQEALAGDNLDKAKSAAAELASLAREHAPMIAAATKRLSKAGNLEAARKAFHEVSRPLIKMARAGKAGEGVYHAQCPMAFQNTGGAWLQDSEKLANPYFGASMHRCGSIQPVAKMAGMEGTEEGHMDHHHN